MKISKVGAAVIKDGKVLVVKESGWEKYGFPGGTIKPNENDVACLVREVKEELNANIKMDSLKYLGTYEDMAMNEPDKIIQIKLYALELENNPEKTSEIEDMFWFSKDDNFEILGPIDKNYLVPVLIDNNLVK